MKVDIEIQDSELRQALNQLLQAGSDLHQPLAQSGEFLAETTKQRFQTSTAPDGSRWAPNSPVTLDAYLSKYSSKGRRGRAGSKKPLIGESKSLSTTIFYQVSGNEMVVGSPMEYAAVQQLGARKGQFGKTARGGSIPWGDIPAREFAGVSDGDEEGLRAIFNRHLQGG